MRRIAPLVMGIWFTMFAPGSYGAAPSASLDDYIRARLAEFDQIPAGRRSQLAELTAFVRDQRKAGRPVRITFICTHNSRRSQLAQVWTAIAAQHFKVDQIASFSGGTEQTAFNPRAVAALERAGVKIEQRDTPAENPRYEVAAGDRSGPLVCFSKVYDQPPNPQADFAAVMVCSDADQNCPIVRGATVRIAVPYDDPKRADGTPGEQQTYDERCRQIAREMLFVFSAI